MSFTLTFLGTGCGLPMADRFHSSILLEAGAGEGSERPRRYLLDAGEPCSHRLKALGVPFGSLDAIFISHGHSDHIAGLPMVIQGAWLEPRRRPLPIYLPGELIAPLRAWLEAVYLPDKLIGFPITWHAWESAPAPVEMEDGLRVRTYPTTHLDGLHKLIAPQAAERFKPYSIDLEWPERGKRLVYSADLGRPQDLDAPLRRPVDVLICEMSHFSPAALFAYLADKSIGALLLTHLTAEFSKKAESLQRQATGQLPHIGEVRIMRDGTQMAIF